MGMKKEFSNDLIGVYRPSVLLLVSFVILQLALIIYYFNNYELSITGEKKQVMAFWAMVFVNIFLFAIFFIKSKQRVEIKSTEIEVVSFRSKQVVLIESIQWVTLDEYGLTFGTSRGRISLSAFGDSKEIQLFNELKEIGVRTNEYTIGL